MNLYNIRRGPHGYRLGKFDPGLNLLAAYDVTPTSCTCPAGPRPTCKHRKMLPRMLGKVDTAEFYCYEINVWQTPLPVEPGFEVIDEASHVTPEMWGQPEPELSGEAVAVEAPELYGSMSPERKDLLEIAKEMRMRMAEKLLLNGAPELEGKLTGLLPTEPPKPTPQYSIRRR